MRVCTRSKSLKERVPFNPEKRKHQKSKAAVLSWLCLSNLSSPKYPRLQALFLPGKRYQTPMQGMLRWCIKISQRCVNQGKPCNSTRDHFESKNSEIRNDRPHLLPSALDRLFLVFIFRASRLTCDRNQKLRSLFASGTKSPLRQIPLLTTRNVKDQKCPDLCIL